MSAAISNRAANTIWKACSSAWGAAIDAIGAKRVVLDTIETLFAGLPNPLILRAELRRLFRWLKDKGVTAIITGERGDGTLTRQGVVVQRKFAPMLARQLTARCRCKLSSLQCICFKMST